MTFICTIQCYSSIISFYGHFLYFNLYAISYAFFFSVPDDDCPNDSDYVLSSASDDSSDEADSDGELEMLPPNSSNFNQNEIAPEALRDDPSIGKSVERGKYKCKI